MPATELHQIIRQQLARLAHGRHPRRRARQNLNPGLASLKARPPHQEDGLRRSQVAKRRTGSARVRRRYKQWSFPVPPSHQLNGSDNPSVETIDFQVFVKSSETRVVTRFMGEIPAGEESQFLDNFVPTVQS